MLSLMKLCPPSPGHPPRLHPPCPPHPLLLPTNLMTMRMHHCCFLTMAQVLDVARLELLSDDAGTTSSGHVPQPSLSSQSAPFPDPSVNSASGSMPDSAPSPAMAPFSDSS